MYVCIYIYMERLLAVIRHQRDSDRSEFRAAAKKELLSHSKGGSILEMDVFIYISIYMERFLPVVRHQGDSDPGKFRTAAQKELLKG